MSAQSAPSSSLQETSNALIQQILTPSEAKKVEHKFQNMLEELLHQDIPLDLIQGIEALFRGWHEQKYGQAPELDEQHLKAISEIDTHFGHIHNPTQHLQQWIAKAIQQPHHHLDFLELLYTCGKLGLKLPTLDPTSDQNQTLSQLYYLIRANKPLREQLTATPMQLPVITLPHKGCSALMHLAQMSTAYGLIQLGFLLWTWVLTHS